MVVHNARSRGGQQGAGRGEPHGNTTKATQAQVKIAELEGQLKALKAGCGSAKEKRELAQKIKNLREAGARAKKEKPMGRRDTSSALSNWNLNIGSGLGPVCLGDPIEKWISPLELYFDGDLDSQLERFFLDSKIKRENNPQLVGEYLTYRSSRCDLWVEVVGESRSISQISTAEHCFYKNRDLIGLSVRLMSKLLNSKYRRDIDPLGESLFFDEIGIIVRLGKKRVIEWIAIEKVSID